MGSGFPDVAKAVGHLNALETCCATHNPSLPEGSLHAGFIPPKTREFEWRLEPSGQYKGIWLELRKPAPEKTQAVLKVFSKKEALVGEIPLNGHSRKLFVPGNVAKVRFIQPKAMRVPFFALDYYVETIDSSTLYCSGNRYFELNKGTISDGSRASPYANNCDCKWQIG